MRQSFLYLEERGVYSGALIKKRRYWPNNVPGDSINRNFVNKEVEDVEILEAKMDDGNPFIYISLKIQIML